MENNSEKSIIYFNTRDEMLKVNLHNVVYFQADRNYTEVFFVNGIHATLSLGLVNIERMLDEPMLSGVVPPFVRVGRGFIINPHYIFQINLIKQELILSDTHSPAIYKITVSKEALKKLKEIYIR